VLGNWRLTKGRSNVYRLLALCSEPKLSPVRNDRCGDYKPKPKLSVADWNTLQHMIGSKGSFEHFQLRGNPGRLGSTSNRNQLRRFDEPP
jgi:hypothetical protein